MAAVIHSLWEKGDRNPLILPANIPIDDSRVQFELTRYLSDNWLPVIEKDVDGAHSLPLRIDAEQPNLGKYHACRRVARAVYLGSAPTGTAANVGIEDRQIKLGCVMPGESPAVFGDALRRLSAAATYLYADGSRYWYSVQPTVTKLAADRAQQLLRDPDKAAHEIEKRVRADLQKTGDFVRVHPVPQSSQDIPDETDVRLVVLSTTETHNRDADSPALAAAKQILTTRGNAPRIYQNALVFLAADHVRMQDLDEAVRRYLAWESIVAEKEKLDLSPFQVKQAETQKASADSAVAARLPEAYQWLLVPGQKTPHASIEWQSVRASSSNALAVRASKKLRDDESLITAWAGTLLRREMDKIPLWRGNHVSIRQLADDFAKYLYLPRVANSKVIVDAASDGLGRLTWEQETFAYADSFDESASRYVGLRLGEAVSLRDATTGLLVKADVAKNQRDSERPPEPPPPDDKEKGKRDSDGVGGVQPPLPSPPPVLRRFHGSISLDPTRLGRDAGRVADEVVSHLAGLVGANVSVTLEIQAEASNGVPEKVVRIVNENCRTLKFTQAGFEEQ
jgi:hypothetical protein